MNWNLISQELPTSVCLIILLLYEIINHHNLPMTFSSLIFVFVVKNLKKKNTCKAFLFKYFDKYLRVFYRLLSFDFIYFYRISKWLFILSHYYYLFWIFIGIFPLGFYLYFYQICIWNLLVSAPFLNYTWCVMYLIITIYRILNMFKKRKTFAC